MTPRAEIERERQRQVEAEGWSAEHDDAHGLGELMRAAICYYLSGTSGVLLRADTRAPVDWPWSPEWWKPHGKRRDLVRAGALCLAERERQLRRDPGTGVNYLDHWLGFVELALQVTPKRIRRSRAKGWQMPPGAAYVGRPTRWGNLWEVGLKACGCRSVGECGCNQFRCETAEEATATFREWILGARAIPGNAVDALAEELRGKDLACWCGLDRPCHADLWLELANPSAVQS